MFSGVLNSVRDPRVLERVCHLGGPSEIWRGNVPIIGFNQDCIRRKKNGELFVVLRDVETNFRHSDPVLPSQIDAEA